MLNVILFAVRYALKFTHIIQQFQKTKKHRQYTGHMKTDTRINNDAQNTTNKTKD
jgi:hypothetical protein